MDTSTFVVWNNRQYPTLPEEWVQAFRDRPDSHSYTAGHDPGQIHEYANLMARAHTNPVKRLSGASANSSFRVLGITGQFMNQLEPSLCPTLHNYT